MKIESEEGGGVFWKEYVSFPPCPKCRKREQVGRNPEEETPAVEFKERTFWYCYRCRIHF